jgi:hypothetical protein
MIPYEPMKFFSFRNPFYCAICIISFVIVIWPTGGCASAVHTRTTANGVVEKTSIHTFLSTTAIKGFSESTRDGSGTNGYLRTVRVSDAGTQTEIEKLQGLGEAIARGATEGAAKGAKGGL